jgi:hypothetical protein
MPNKSANAKKGGAIKNFSLQRGQVDIPEKLGAPTGKNRAKATRTEKNGPERAQHVPNAIDVRPQAQDSNLKPHTRSALGSVALANRSREYW